MTRKTVVNADAGDADTFGGDDVDNLMNDLARGPFPYTCQIIKDGSTFHEISPTGESVQSDTDASTVVQAAIDGATDGGLFLFAPQTFSFSTKISIPIGVTPITSKPYVLQGTHSNVRQTATTFKPTTTFPDQSFIIDAGVTPASGKVGSLKVSGIFFYNPYPWTGGATTSTDKRVGGILFGSDNLSTTGNIRTLSIEKCQFQYIWRGVDLQGAVYGAFLDNLEFESASTGTRMEYDLKMEKAGLADVPKLCHIGSVVSTHTGVLDNAYYIEGVYNYFENIGLDGTLYLDAPIKFAGGTNSCISNFVNRVMLLDLNGIPGAGNYATGPGNVADARVAAVVFDGANCYDNHILRAEVGRAPYMVAYTNSSFRNEIELSYFGNTVNINDAGAGIENVVYIAQGQQPSATANTKITSSNSLVKIVDRRKGATTDGTSTQSGNGSTKIFNIAHGCFTTPTVFSVFPTTANAAGNPVLTATSTNIVVTYPVAPPTGSSNLGWVWRAEVY